jgi:hypothetical protein
VIVQFKSRILMPGEKSQTLRKKPDQENRSKKLATAQPNFILQFQRKVKE